MWLKWRRTRAKRQKAVPSERHYEPGQEPPEPDSESILPHSNYLNEQLIAMGARAGQARMIYPTRLWVDFHLLLTIGSATLIWRVLKLDGATLAWLLGGGVVAGVALAHVTYRLWLRRKKPNGDTYRR